jgi:energy-coupling factor transport system ATP-binding protein
MVFQEPSLQFVSWSVAEEIAFGLENLGWASREVEAAVGDALERWGLANLAARHPRHLSGGQMAAVALASVLVMGPHYLILDEPGPLLDGAGKSLFLRAVREIVGRKDTGLLWVTECPEEAALCERTVVICRGEIVADERSGDLLTRPASLRRWGLEPTPATLVSHKLIQSGAELRGVHIEAGALLEELRRGPGDTESVITPAAGDKDPRPLLKAVNAGFSYDGEIAALEDLCLEVGPGEGIGLAGPSGAGKSTAVYLASGALRPTAGSVRREHGRAVGLCTQFPEEQFCANTVAAEVSLVGTGDGRRGERFAGRALKCLEMVGFKPGDIADRAPLSLSDGEKKRVALATAIASGEKLLVLDEPTLGLDGRSAERAVQAVLKHLEAGGGVLVASQDGDFLLRTTGGAVLMELGRQCGFVRWERDLGAGRASRKLPRGQLLELCSVCGLPPAPATFASIDALTDWLACRFMEFLEAPHEDGRSGPFNGAYWPENGVRTGKCP